MVTTARHVLLTVLGTQKNLATYRLGDKVADSELAPVALYKLLPEDPPLNEIVALCTPRAADATWPALEKLGEHVAVRKIDVPTGETPEEMGDFLRALLRGLPDEGPVELTVDVTHGFRHFSFLLYTGLLYLTALREVRLRQVWYALWKPHPGISQFLDLGPLLEFPRWFNALRMFHDTGSPASIVRLLRGSSGSEQAANVARLLGRISSAFLAGLPLELGRASREYLMYSRNVFRKVLRRDHRLPLVEDLDETLARFVEPFAFDEMRFSDGWKKRVALDESELDRQARLIEALLEKGHVPNALGLMQEWTVSWAMLGRGEGSPWLDYHGGRKLAAGKLHALRAVSDEPSLSPLLDDDQQALASYWKELSDLRNAYHHHGFRPGEIVSEECGRGKGSKLGVVVSYWRETLRSVPRIPLDFAGEDRGAVLVTPLGRSPGVLYSAIETARESARGRRIDVCVVLTSGQARSSAADAFGAAAYDGERRFVVFEDPFGGLDEIARRVGSVKGELAAASEVFVNVTGGTTLLGLAADRMAAEARSFAKPVRRFGLIDTRTPEEQRTDPFRRGTAFWLDDEANEEA